MASLSELEPVQSLTWTDSYDGQMLGATQATPMSGVPQAANYADYLSLFPKASGPGAIQIGGSTIPAMSGTEQQILTNQVGGLNTALNAGISGLSDARLLTPHLYQNAGLTPQYDAQGRLTGYADQNAANRDLNTGVTNQLLTQLQGMLGGDIAGSPTLQADIDRQRQQLHQRLLAQMGPGYATSTPGIQALQEFETKMANALEDNRRSYLQQIQNMYSNVQGTQNATTANTANLLTNAAGLEPGLAGIVAQIASQYNSPAGRLATERLAPLDAAIKAAIASGQSNSKLISGLLGAGGTILGQALGSGGTLSNLLNSAGSAGATDSSGGMGGGLTPNPSTLQSVYDYLFGGAGGAGAAANAAMAPAQFAGDMSALAGIGSASSLAPDTASLAAQLMANGIPEATAISLATGATTGALSSVAASAMPVYQSLIASGMPAAEAALTAFGSGAAGAGAGIGAGAAGAGAGATAGTTGAATGAAAGLGSTMLAAAPVAILAIIGSILSSRNEKQTAQRYQAASAELQQLMGNATTPEGFEAFRHAMGAYGQYPYEHPSFVEAVGDSLPHLLPGYAQSGMPPGTSTRLIATKVMQYFGEHGAWPTPDMYVPWYQQAVRDQEQAWQAQHQAQWDTGR